MKKSILYFLFVAISLFTDAQTGPKLIATTPSTIFKYTGDSTYTTKTHVFTNNGPQSSTLTEGPNGKLYGLTSGYNNFSLPGGLGSVFEYDYNTDSFRMVANFNYNTGCTPFGSLLLASNGILYGVTSYGGANVYSGTLFSYTIGSDSVVKLADMPPSASPSGPLVQARNGKLYGVTSGGGSGGYSRIFSYDITADTMTMIYALPTAGITGGLIEIGADTLYGFAPNGGAGNAAFIYQFIPAGDSGTFTIVHNISPVGIAIVGTPLYATDRKIYGMTNAGINTTTGNSIFSYELTTNTYTNVYNFGTIFMDGTDARGDLSQASDSIIYGMTKDGGRYYGGVIFSYNISNSTYTRLVDLDTNGSNPDLGHFIGYTPHAIILSNPLNIAICAGSMVSFTASARGSALTQHWQLSADNGISFTNIAGATDTTYSFTAFDYQNTYQYRLIFKNNMVLDTSATATLTVFSEGMDTIRANLCDGTAYQFGGHSYTIAGLYKDTISGVSPHGCDSIITIMLSEDTVNAHFVLQQSGLSHFWYAINTSKGNGLSYIWNWGDNSPYSTGDTPTHIYSTPGYYTICVTANDSLCSSTFCDSNSSSSAAMATVNVVIQIPSGINTITPDHLNINYYAGAAHFSESLQAPTQLRLYDMSGRVVMSQDNFGGNIWDIHSDIAQGVYVIQLQNGSYSLSKKLMILK